MTQNNDASNNDPHQSPLMGLPLEKQNNSLHQPPAIQAAVILKTEENELTNKENKNFNPRISKYGQGFKPRERSNNQNGQISLRQIDSE